MTKRELLNKVKGAFVGLAIGDAMGATTEFMKPREIHKAYGTNGVQEIIGGGWLHLKAGEVTDDTQMTMCVARAILSSTETNGAIAQIDENHFLACCMANFLNWYSSGPLDVGNQCRRVLGLFSKLDRNDMADIAWTKLWYRAASNKHAYGNGSLMRALPAALVGTKYALAQGRLTHNNNVCDAYIREYCDVLHLAMTGIIDRTQLHPKSNGGAIYETMDGACYWLAHTDNFRDCIVGVVNNGGDADTIGAVAGSLAGCCYGYGAIPSDLVVALDPSVRLDLIETAERFVELDLVSV